jgi:NADH-quinone oxidoreductase subunit N
MFLETSDEAIPYFKSKNMMRAGLILTVIGVLVLGLYSPLYNYVVDLSKDIIDLNLLSNLSK